METGQIIAIVVTILVTIVAEYLFIKNMNLSFRLVNYLMIFLILAVPVTTVSLFVALNIKLPPPKTKCPKDCSGNGTCDALTGKCTCNAGYFGNDCSKPVPPDCGGKGTYDADKKTCTCNPPYSGPDCSVNCSTVTCNKEGTCNPEDGTCTCTGKNFTGPNCDQCKGNFALPNCDTCKGNFALPNCDTCTGNFTGPNCDQCKGNFALPNCDTCKGNFALPNCDTCTGNFALPNCNTCTGNFALPDCTTCIPNWYGSTKCDKYCDATTCNGNGNCDQDTGVCKCNPNGHFANPTCKGTVAGTINGGGGNCADGWEGLKCDQKVCPWGDNNTECSGHGTCGAGGTCSCNFGYVGKSCSTSLIFLIIVGIIFGVGLVAYLIWWLVYKPYKPSGIAALPRKLAEGKALEEAEKAALEELKGKSLNKQEQQEFIKQKKEAALATINETPEQTARRKLLKDISDNTKVPGYGGRKAYKLSEELDQETAESKITPSIRQKADAERELNKKYINELGGIEKVNDLLKRNAFGAGVNPYEQLVMRKRKNNEAAEATRKERVRQINQERNALPAVPLKVSNPSQQSSRWWSIM